MKNLSSDNNLVQSDLPIIVEPSQVYCRADGKSCKYRLPLSRWCKRAYKEIPISADLWKATDWCPLKINALFGLPVKD